MNRQASVNIARVTYLLICELLGLAVALTFSDAITIATGLIGGLLIAGFFILIETTLKGFTLRGFSTATFGLGVGLFCAWLITRVDIADLVSNMIRENAPTKDDDESIERRLIMYDRANAVRLAINASLYSSLGFLGAVLALRGNRDDFALIIPFVRFRQEGTQGRPLVLDTDAVMDSRVTNIAKAGFLGARLIIPRFILHELQTLAASPTLAHKQRGQRGLDVLEQMQKEKGIEVVIHESGISKGEQTIHARLIEVSKLLDARLLTNNDNLGKVARLQGIAVLNLHELTDALKPSVVVGESMRLALVRPGRDEHQAVGFLSDGTMIVVNHSANLIGTTQKVHVISTLQTSNGLMVFAEIEDS
jgi:uncharacterized protein YacL